jgi:hypothetical protein
MTSRSSPLTMSASDTARPWWQLGLAAGFVAAVINVISYFVVQIATSAPPRIVPPGQELQDLFLGMVVLMSLIPPLIAALLAYGLSRWTSAASAWLIGISLVVLVLSLLSPLTQPATVTTGTKLVLAVMHVVVAAVTLAALVPRLSAERR